MQYVPLGRTGLKVSRLCLGCMSYGDPAKGWHRWILDYDLALPFFRAAIEAGVTFFDTANVYAEGSSEEFLGRAVREFAGRESVVIATKVGGAMGRTMSAAGADPNGRGLSRKHIMASIDASLRRLGMDYVDLYQAHIFDSATPMEETLEAFHDVVKAGKARYIGASNWPAWQLAKALGLQRQHGWAAFASVQQQYNLVYREDEREMLPLCRDAGVAHLPWSPLARGFLTGNYAAAGGETARAQSDQFSKQLYYKPQDYAVVEGVTKIAGELGVTKAQVALAWMLAKPGVCAPVIGLTKSHHLDDARKALELKLSDAQVRALEELYQPRWVPAPP